MTAFDQFISRTNVETLIPEQKRAEIIEGVTEQSAVLQLFTRIPVAAKTLTMPVLSTLPVAYWVNGDTGLKKTTSVAWADKTLTIEELAVIVPIPDAVFDDTAERIEASIKARVTEAFGRKLDATVFFGTDAPASFPDDVVTSAVAAGNVFARGTSTAALGGIAEDINKTMALAEADGFAPDGFITSRAYKSRLRSARGTDGQALMDVNLNQLYGEQVMYALPGLWPTGVSAAELIAIDRSQFVVGVRQDITFKWFDQGVISDDGGLTVYNLMQQDMKALRAVMRIGWQVANPMTHDQAVEANRYPAAVLRSPAA